MTPQFTPGPWDYERRTNPMDLPRPWVGRLTENRYSALACGETHDEATANAHLIAAAPELYEALELAAEIISNQFRDGFAHNDDDPDFPGLPSYYIGPGVLPKLSAALAKARGEAA